MKDSLLRVTLLCAPLLAAMPTEAKPCPPVLSHEVTNIASALYDALAKATGERPQWNFHKYLVSRDGKAVASFGSKVEPGSAQFVRKVEELLGA